MEKNNILEFLKSQYKYGGMFVKIIMANAIVFVALLLLKVISELFILTELYSSVGEFLSMPGTFSSLLYKPWSIITALFTHFEFGHLFWNMIMFYFTAKMFVQFFGNTRLLSTYIFGGIFGGLAHILSYIIFPYFSNQDPASIVGASAAVSAIVGALVFYKPELKVRLFFAIEVPFWVLGLLFIAGDIINLTAEDGVAHFAHLGGVAFGILSVLKVNQLPNFMNKLDKLVTFKFSFKRQPKMKVYRNTDTKKMTDEVYNSNKANKQEQMNVILDKISEHGYERLSKKEKDFLFKFGNE
jgi:membrane associated rhomboid family serine protease